MFHNLFPHSSPLHVYKQSPVEEKKERERVGDRGGGSPGNMSGQGRSVEQKEQGNEL